MKHGVINPMSALRQYVAKTKRRLRDRKRLQNLKAHTDVSEPQEPPRLVDLSKAHASKTIWHQEFPLRYRSDNLKFIHVGKCGGTSIMHHFLASGIDIDEHHMSKPIIGDRVWYFIWIRDPLSRFVSAFNHAKSITDFDCSSLDPENLTIANCPAPQKIHNRMTKGYAFDPEYDALVAHFSTANALAESLSSSNRAQARRARDLMQRPQEHIYKGIGWHLDNGQWVDTCHRQIIMVGCVETMNPDFDRLLKKLDWNALSESAVARKRSGSTSLPHHLSAVARRNLREFYQQTDYAAISALHKHGLIGDDIVDRYQSDR